MTKLTRWDTGATIHETNGDIRSTVKEASELWISCFRASLDRANLAGANLDGASLVGASLVGASLDGANLDGANLDGANLVGASLPIYCKWSVTWSTVDAKISVAIGCKSKSIDDWDAWFSGSEQFDTPRDTDDFRRINANYLAVRAYLVAMGLHSEPSK
jgi:hypothetical protein